MNEAKELYRQGVHAVRDLHDIEQGRKLLAMSLRLDPQNDDGWVWLARAVTNPEQKRKCIDRALAINPGNPRAQKLREHFTVATASAARNSVASATHSTGSFAVALAARAPAAKPRTTTTHKARATTATVEAPRVSAATSTITGLLRAVGDFVQPGESAEEESDALKGVNPATLGKRVLITGPRKLYFLGWILVLFVLIGVAAFILIAGPLSPSHIKSTTDALYVGGALLLLLAALWIGADVYEKIRTVVVLMEGGVMISKFHGQKAWRWDQFTSVVVEEHKIGYGSIIGRILYGDNATAWALEGRKDWYGVWVDTMFEVNLRIDNKRVLKISRAFRDARKVRELILEATGKALLPDYMRRYERGETLEFGGKIRISRAEGLQGHRGMRRLGWWWREPVPFREITGMYIEERPEQTDLLVVLLIDTAHKFDLNKVPNAHVLETLLEKITGWQIV